MLGQIFRRPRLGIGLGLLVLVALGILLQPPGRRTEGTIRLVDGDSFWLDGVEIRLKGVDAPELQQTCLRGGRPYRCGEAARAALAAKVGQRPLACRVEGRDRYRRSLARCRLDGEDLGAWLVREGWAVGYRDYEAEEASARARGAGLWAGPFERPSDWRREHTRSDLLSRLREPVFAAALGRPIHSPGSALKRVGAGGPG